jgi:membrane-bound ClpP family serine protease
MTLVLALIAAVVFPSACAGIALLASASAFVVGEHVHKHDGYPCHTVGRNHLTTDGATVLVVFALIVLTRLVLAFA